MWTPSKLAIARGASPRTQVKLNNGSWQALIGLYRSLLDEHHDFFLASQYPPATFAIRRLAMKRAKPAICWFLQPLVHSAPRFARSYASIHVHKINIKNNDLRVRKKSERNQQSSAMWKCYHQALKTGRQYHHQAIHRFPTASSQTPLQIKC